MKVAYIGKFKNLWDEEGIAVALESHGVEVLRISDGSGDPTARILEYRPDFVLTAKMQFNGGWQFLAAMREAKIPTVSWTFDLLIGHPEREPTLDAFVWLKTDYVFLTDGGNTELYHTKGVEKITLRQGIVDAYAYMAEPVEEYAHDIVFVGTINHIFPYRQDTMRFLKDTYGKRFHWYGANNHLEIRGHELNKLYASAKIVMGDSVYSPYYWSNRLYETLGRGGFTIFPAVEGLSDEYKPHKHYIPYNWGDYPDLKKKIDYFLEHPEARDEIRTAAFEYTKEHYLMSHRVKQLLCALPFLTK